MEEVIGNMAYFTPAERELLGVPGPLAIDTLDMTVHYDRVHDRRAFVVGKREGIEGDYDQLMARQAELFQLDWDEATLMDIEYDLASTRAMLSDVVFDKMISGTGPSN